jgi:hypothetical protein
LILRWTPSEVCDAEQGWRRSRLRGLGSLPGTSSLTLRRASRSLAPGALRYHGTIGGVAGNLAASCCFPVGNVLTPAESFVPVGDGRVWGSPGLQGRRTSSLRSPFVPRAIPAGPPSRRPWITLAGAPGSTLTGEPARWGESPERSRGYGLHHRPPDVDPPACAGWFVFEDLRPGRSRMRMHPSARPSWPSVPSFPTPACPSVQSVARLDCLSWVCPKIAPPPSWQHRSPLPASPRGVTFEMGMPAPTCVPPSWFCTTSTAFSSDTVRVCCNALPAMGFTPFPACRSESPRSARPSPRCLPCPPELSLRPKLRPNPRPRPRERGCDLGSTAGPRHLRVATQFTAVLASSPFPFLSPTRRCGRPHVRVQVGSVGPRGLPPRTGPLRCRRLPADLTRCSPGLARISLVSSTPRDGFDEVSEGTSKTAFPNPVCALPHPR